MLPWLNGGENVVLEVKSTKFKKENGILFVTVNRVVWARDENPSDPSVQYEYSQIKAQRISPDSAPKVRLQLVLHDDTTVTFHFSNPIAELQKAERERVKEVLVQLLQKNKKAANKEEPSKKQVSKELELKQKILQGSEEMFIMYKTLVSGGIISAEDFWTLPKAEELLSNEQNQQQAPGVSSAFLSETRPEVDGCNSIQYNLTTDIIQSIFHTYPMIKRKYHEMVPAKITEKEFWTKFFQSQYFHKDKGSSNGPKTDLFLTLAQEDEETYLQKLLMTERDPLFDISESVNNLVSEGFGVMQVDNNSSSKPLVRKYNHHSYMICQDFSKSDLDNQKAADLQKKEQLKEITKQNDLEGEATQSNVPLKLTNSKLKGSSQSESRISFQEASKALEKTQFDIKNFDLSKMHETIKPGTAFSAMMDITEHSLSSNSSLKIPKAGSSSMEDIRVCYLNASQILCHFWMCFPVTNVTLEEKVNRMAESIMKYKNTALQDTMKKLPSKDSRFLKHLSSQLDLALLTHEQWKAKKGKR